MYARNDFVTPEQAERWLLKNTGNYRKINARKVEQYAQDMKQGGWKENGESIKFHSDGSLFDGQHRLAAIVKANVPVKMLVVWGIDNDVQICDSGMNRTQLQIMKASETDKRLHNTHIISMVNRITAKDLDVHKQAPRVMTAKYIEEHRDLLAELPSLVSRGEGHAISRNSACYLAAYIHMRRGTDMKIISSFFKIVNSGFVDDFVDGSSAVVLRNLLLRKKGMKHTGDAFKIIYANALLLIYDYMDQKKRRRQYEFSDVAQMAFDELIEKETEA